MESQSHEPLGWTYPLEGGSRRSGALLSLLSQVITASKEMEFPEGLDQVSSPPLRDWSVSVAPNYLAGKCSVVVEMTFTVRKSEE
jgi:hypothetical protein